MDSPPIQSPKNSQPLTWRTSWMPRPPYGGDLLHFGLAGGGSWTCLLRERAVRQNASGLTISVSMNCPVGCWHVFLQMGFAPSNTAHPSSPNSVCRFPQSKGVHFSDAPLRGPQRAIFGHHDLITKSHDQLTLRGGDRHEQCTSCTSFLKDIDGTDLN